MRPRQSLGSSIIEERTARAVYTNPKVFLLAVFTKAVKRRVFSCPYESDKPRPRLLLDASPSLPAMETRIACARERTGRGPGRQAPRRNACLY